jgi:HlyD family secretion protein
MRQVITGIQNDNYIEIISGVQAGERIVKAPYDAISKLLNNGSKVEVVQEKELYKITKNY